MSDKPSSKPQSEEVDLAEILKIIGNLFSKLYYFIESKLKSVFSIFIFLFKAIIVNFKLIIISMIITAVIGFGLEKSKPVEYYSSMLVIPHYSSKYQLIKNIDYYNDLIDEGNYEKLSSLFQIDEQKSKELLSFEVKNGPRNKNQIYLEYEDFIKNIDSTRASSLTFKDYVDNRKLYASTTFEIGVRASSKTIFKFLDKGLKNIFENEYSKKLKKEKEILLELRKTETLKAVNAVDSLQRVYVNVILNESSSQGKILTSKDGVSLVQERVKTKEYELLTKKLQLREVLKQIEIEKIKSEDYFEIITPFENIGTKYKSFGTKYYVVFPCVILLLLVFIFLIKRFTKFVLSYK